MWKCHRCAEGVEDNFDVCWNCGTSFGGEDHPDFPADIEAFEQPDGWVPRIRCEKCGYEGQVLLAHFGYRWWMFLIVIALFPAAIFLLLAFMLIANHRFRRCPQCGNHEKLREIDTEPAPAANVVWETATKLDAEKFAANKLRMLGIALVMFALSCVAMYFAIKS